MIRLTWLLLLSTLCPLLRAQTSLRTDLVKKAVVFLYAADNSDPKNSLGTGFLIMCTHEGNAQSDGQRLVFHDRSNLPYHGTPHR